jgi:hypothetical protein
MSACLPGFQTPCGGRLRHGPRTDRVPQAGWRTSVRPASTAGDEHESPGQAGFLRLELRVAAPLGTCQLGKRGPGTAHPPRDHNVYAGRRGTATARAASRPRGPQCTFQPLPAGPAALPGLPGHRQLTSDQHPSRPITRKAASASAEPLDVEASQRADLRGRMASERFRPPHSSGSH